MWTHPSKRSVDPKLVRMSQIDAFGHCTGAELVAAAQAFDDIRLDAGARICRQGAFGHEAFVIRSGRIQVEIDGEIVAHIGAGETAGELAPLGGKFRNADLVCDDDCDLMVANGPEFNGLVATSPGLRKFLNIELAERAQRRRRLVPRL